MSGLTRRVAWGSACWRVPATAHDTENVTPLRPGDTMTYRHLTDRAHAYIASLCRHHNRGTGHTMIIIIIIIPGSNKTYVYYSSQFREKNIILRWPSCPGGSSVVVSYASIINYHYRLLPCESCSLTPKMLIVLTGLSTVPIV